jgi:hypothetical protein
MAAFSEGGVVEIFILYESEVKIVVWTEDFPTSRFVYKKRA